MIGVKIQFIDDQAPSVSTSGGVIAVSVDFPVYASSSISNPTLIKVIDSAENENDYEVTELAGMEVKAVLFGNATLEDGQWLKPKASTVLHLIDENEPIQSGKKITIFYTS